MWAEVSKLYQVDKSLFFILTQTAVAAFIFILILIANPERERERKEPTTKVFLRFTVFCPPTIFLFSIFSHLTAVVGTSSCATVRQTDRKFLFLTTFFPRRSIWPFSAVRKVRYKRESFFSAHAWKTYENETIKFVTTSTRRSEKFVGRLRIKPLTTVLVMRFWWCILW